VTFVAPQERTEQVPGPRPLWAPSPERAASSRLGRWLSSRGFPSYDKAWEWSVAPATAGEFWWDVAEHFALPWRREPEAMLEADASRAPGYRWGRGAKLNYAEAALRPPPSGPASPAVVALSQTRPPAELSWAELAEMVAGVRAGLLAAGVKQKDRVAGYLPNVPEALAAMLASASIGAIWSSCPPEMGVTGVLDRLSQMRPAVFISVDGYRYGERAVPRREEALAVLNGLAPLKKAVWLPYLGEPAPRGWARWDDFVAGTAPPASRRRAAAEALSFEPLDFEHPLYVLFSSGTTGKPKPIVHGHGGILLEHLKCLGFHFDLGPGDRFFWFSTTGWMMWNFCVSGLLLGATVVLFDGNPTWPESGSLWELMASAKVTCGGVGSAYLVQCAKAGFRPASRYDLGALRTLGATGSPLPAGAAKWAYEAVKDDLLLASFSGGTDVCTGFVGASPVHPVWPGEISCRCLGARVEVFDEAGRAVVGQEGELVLAGPLPSMPVGFWGDNGSRYREAYFAKFPGIWAHGDRAMLTERGTVVITGRSDATLNRGGVRMGTAEFYSVVEGLPGVADSLAVHIEDPEGGPGQLWLFLVEAPGYDGPPLEAVAREAVRRELSPRYVPDKVALVPAVPRTLSGKKLEVPVKRILMGAPVGEAVALASVANPESLEAFVGLRAGLAGTSLSG
jgi:acetoacetyl-CoA synthetase